MKWKIISIFTVILFVSSYGISVAEDMSEDESQTEIYNVDEVMESPDDFTDTFLIRGVVSGCDAEKEKLVLIDCTEYEDCDVVTCARYMLPVRWAGEMPQVEDTVILRGSIQETDDGLMFVAEELEILEADD
ncbi:MAG TPA: hypothetical protein VGB30_12780 [bacterium]|jgi:hypothetical protein